MDDVTQAPISKVYPSHGLPRAMASVDVAVGPGANVAADPTTKSLLVTARPQVHEMLEQLMVDFRTMVSAGKVIADLSAGFGRSDGSQRSADGVIAQCQVTADKVSRTLMVVADEEDQSWLLRHSSRWRLSRICSNCEVMWRLTYRRIDGTRIAKLVQKRCSSEYCCRERLARRDRRSHAGSAPNDRVFGQ